MQVIQGNFGASTFNQCPLNHILQFAHVSRELILLEGVNRLTAQGRAWNPGVIIQGGAEQAAAPSQFKEAHEIPISAERTL